jgi:ppGpp synthetase/RelA/SpoT-type nucleotidyltranferase
LAAIYEDHSSLREELEDTASFVATKLRRLPAVHSVRTRIKDPGHLVRKIVRKKLEDPSRVIGFANYKEEITDRVGIRALHLFKEDWRPIHAFVVDEWDLVCPPVAYHRDGDHPDWLAAFQAADCEVKEHPRKYRSVHYVLRSAGSRASTPVELQVRTVFEEAWSEIDHRINYPDAVPFPNVGFFLQIFNRLAGSSDEMGSFLNRLTTELRELTVRADQAEAEGRAASAKVDELIEKLAISTSERQALRKELRAVESARTATAVSGQAAIGGAEQWPWLTTHMAVKPEWLHAGLTVPARSTFFNTEVATIMPTRPCPHCGGSVPSSMPPGAIVSICPSCGRTA